MTSSPSRVVLVAFGAAALAVVPGVSRAQEDVAALRSRYTIVAPSADVASVIENEKFLRGSPGATSGSMLAFGPNWGDAFIGVSLQAQTRGAYNYVTKTTSENRAGDGMFAVGVGLGNSRDAVGLEIDISSLSTVHSGAGTKTAFSFKLHRMLDDFSSVAVGVEDGFLAGGGPTDGESSWYVVASRVFMFEPSSPFKALTANFGLGDGRFRSVANITTNRGAMNAFASASLLIINQLSVIADYTGQDVNIGFSFVPIKQVPIAFTPTLADLTGTASKSPRFTLGAGIGMRF